MKHMPTFLDKLLWLVLPILPVNLAWFLIKRRLHAMHVRQTRTERFTAPTYPGAVTVTEFECEGCDSCEPWGFSEDEDLDGDVLINVDYDNYTYCPCGRCTFDPFGEDGKENE